VRDRRGEGAQHSDGAVAHPHVGRIGDRTRQHPGRDRRRQSGRDDQGGADVAHRERHHQTTALPEQFTEREQRDQAGKPQIDGTGLVDEGTADQRADPALLQVVQVGAGVPDDLGLYPRTEIDHREGHRGQGRGVHQGHPQPGQPGQHRRKHRHHYLSV